MEFQNLLSGLALAKSAVEIASSAVDLIADSTKREAARTALDQSKRAFALAEIQIAQQLDYPICRCEFPPLICTSDANHKFTCPKCGADNTPHYGAIN
jgi:hypothetical protein